MEKRKEVITNIIRNFQSIKRMIISEGHFINNGLNITMTQATVLFLIHKKGEMTVTSISSELGITKSAATQMLEGLIQNGYLEKKVDANDRRITNIKLSSESKKQMNKMRDKGIEKVSKIFEVLDIKEIEELNTIMEKLIEKHKEKK